MIKPKIRKYQAPDFLTGKVTQKAYERWLLHKARTHVRRDRKRKNNSAVVEHYKVAIHKAVNASQGMDAYTGEKLKWSKISKFNNVAAKIGGRKYKAKFALLPTVDHVGNGLGKANFKICSWRTNDAKGDLRYRDFLSLCRRVVSYELGEGL
jgi:hypothetical protein